MTSPDATPISEPAPGAAAVEPVAATNQYPVIPIAPDAMLTRLIERAELPPQVKIQETRNDEDRYMS